MVPSGASASCPGGFKIVRGRKTGAPVHSDDSQAWTCNEAMEALWGSNTVSVDSYSRSQLAVGPSGGAGCRARRDVKLQEQLEGRGGGGPTGVLGQ